MEGYKVVSLARMLLLFADATEKNTEATAEGGVMKILLGTPLGLIMGEVSDTVTDIRSRAYINTGKVDKCLCLLYSLILEAGSKLPSSELFYTLFINIVYKIRSGLDFEIYLLILIFIFVLFSVVIHSIIISHKGTLSSQHLFHSSLTSEVQTTAI